MHPSVERRGTFFTATAGLEPHGIRGSLDGVAETCFFLDEEPRQTNTMRLGLGFIPVILSCLCPFHDALLAM
jgi:hypothetical protein